MSNSSEILLKVFSSYSVYRLRHTHTDTHTHTRTHTHEHTHMNTQTHTHTHTFNTAGEIDICSLEKYISSLEIYIFPLEICISFSNWRPPDGNNTSQQLKYTSFSPEIYISSHKKTFHPLLYISCFGTNGLP